MLASSTSLLIERATLQSCSRPNLSSSIGKWTVPRYRMQRPPLPALSRFFAHVGLLSPFCSSWHDLEDSQKTPDTLLQYRRAMENRQENPELDRLSKRVVAVLISFLDVVSTYLQRGKFKISLLIVSTLVAQFSASRACSESPYSMSASSVDAPCLWRIF